MTQSHFVIDEKVLFFIPFTQAHVAGERDLHLRRTQIPGEPAQRQRFHVSTLPKSRNQFDGAAAVKKLMLTVANSEAGNLH